MIAGIPLFDILLAATLVWVAWHLLGAAGRFEAIVLFMTFGMLMAVAWTRLHAPHLALVEAAIGAGLTGALLLDAAGQIEASDREDGPAEPDEPSQTS